MERKFIALGVTSGVAAGIAAFVYARTQISPLIAKAIDYEEARSHAEAMLTGEHGHSHEVFSRSVQENFGAAVGTVVFGMVIGALFAVVFTVLVTVSHRRRMRLDARGMAALLAVAAFVSTSVVPALVYPPNPPGVGLEDTIGDRTSSYLVVVVASVVLATTAVAIGLRLTPRLGGWRSATIAAVGYLALMAIMTAMMPSFQEVPGPLIAQDGEIEFPGFPAEVLSDFRIDSLLCQAISWAVIGTVFASWLPRLARTTSERPLQVGVLHGDR